MTIERLSIPGEGYPFNADDPNKTLQEIEAKHGTKRRVINPGDYDITPDAYRDPYYWMLSVYKDGTGQTTSRGGENTLLEQVATEETEKGPQAIVQERKVGDVFNVPQDVNPFILLSLVYNVEGPRIFEIISYKE